MLELLIAVAVIVLLLGLIVPAVGNFGRATALTTGGNMVANLAGFARQNAMTKGTLTSLVLLTDQGTETDYRALTVLEYNRGSGWAQITPWQNLPTGVLVDRMDTANCTFLVQSPRPFPFVTQPPQQSNPPVLHLGQQVRETAYAARIFLPSGSLQNPEQPAQIRLVEGFLQDGQVIYTRRGGNPGAANYYSVSIVAATGIVKVERP